jgi:hypothetical protein
VKPAHSYQDASMQPPEQPAWMEAEAERASDFEPEPPVFGGESLHDFWNTPTRPEPRCPVCGHEQTFSIIERVTRRVPVILDFENDEVDEVTRDTVSARVIPDAETSGRERARFVAYLCDPDYQGCGARFDTLAALRPQTERSAA